MQEGEPKNGYREQEAAGGPYAPKKVPALERQRQARIKRLQELERQQIELHKQRISVVEYLNQETYQIDFRMRTFKNNY